MDLLLILELDKDYPANLYYKEFFYDFPPFIADFATFYVLFIVDVS